MTLKEPAAASDDPHYRDVPGADILDECAKSARRKQQRKAPARHEPKAEPYNPSPKECAAAGRVLERRKTGKPRIDFAVDHSGGGNSISEVHPDKVIAQVSLLDTFATANSHFSQALLLQMAGISSPPGEPSVCADRLSQAVAMVQGIAPRDEIEAMLATQMVAVHNAVMQSVSSLQCAKTLMAQEAAAGMAQKFAKTFAAQVEALKVYRSTGEQHIHVHRHGFDRNRKNQGGGVENAARQSHESNGSAERGSPLLRKIEAIATAVPGAGA